MLIFIHLSNIFLSKQANSILFALGPEGGLLVNSHPLGFHIFRSQPSRKIAICHKNFGQLFEIKRTMAVRLKYG